MVDMKKKRLLENYRDLFYYLPTWINKVGLSVNSRMVYIYIRDKIVSMERYFEDSDKKLYTTLNKLELEEELELDSIEIRDSLIELVEKDYLVFKSKNNIERIYVKEPTIETLEEIYFNKK